MDTGVAILSQLGAIADLIIAIAVVLLAVPLVGYGVHALYKVSTGNHNYSAGFGFGSIVIGAMLLQYGGFMSGIYESLTGSAGLSSYSQLSYTPPTAAAVPAWAQATLDACVNVIQVFGWGAGISGLLDWRRATQGGHGQGGYDDPVWKGSWKIFGGALAINIPRTINDVLQFLGIT